MRIYVNKLWRRGADCVVLRDIRTRTWPTKRPTTAHSVAWERHSFISKSLVNS